MKTFKAPSAPIIKQVADVIPGDVIVDGAGRERAVVRVDSHGRLAAGKRLVSLVWDEKGAPIFRLPSAWIETRAAA